jgi:hypothetical protein
MKRKIFTLILSAAVFTLVSAQTKELTIKATTKAPVNDGVIDANDPWVEADWVDVALGKDSNVGDMTAKFQLMYDKTNLYFGAKVTDADRFIANGTTYTNDCIEFFIAMDTTSGETGAYKPGDKQLRLQAVADPEATGGLIECGQGAPASGLYVCVDNGTDYVQEWTMPWAELSEGMDPEWDMKQFKFDIQVANATADGARTQQMFWNNNSDQQWQNTTTFGVVTLATPVNLLPAVGVKNVKTAKTFVYDSQNFVLKGVSGVVSVYDITGKQVLKANATNGNLSVASLKKGIYIVNANNSSAKIVR